MPLAPPAVSFICHQLIDSSASARFSDFAPLFRRQRFYADAISPLSHYTPIFSVTSFATFIYEFHYAAAFISSFASSSPPTDIFTLSPFRFRFLRQIFITPPTVYFASSFSFLSRFRFITVFRHLPIVLTPFFDAR
jgi:hypothetical protein